VSNPIEELDDLAVLVIILMVIGAMAWMGFSLIKLFGGGGSLSDSLTAPTAASGSSSKPTLSQIVNSPALPSVSESYGATFASMGTDALSGVGDFFSGIYRGLVGQIFGGDAASNTAPGTSAAATIAPAPSQPGSDGTSTSDYNPSAGQYA
jgi:hypothetical protein